MMYPNRPYILRRAKKPSLTLNLGTNGLKVTSEPPPTAGQASCLQEQDRLAVTHSSSSHARRCLIWLSCDKCCTRHTFRLHDYGTAIVLQSLGSFTAGSYLRVLGAGVEVLDRLVFLFLQMYPADRYTGRQSYGKEILNPR
ncbi:hypothetical protein J6590_098999 [Homalodisca vitripennis]|nr:hypothetical protein J6590_098999 [Homalodisca vitripennis]